jgi:anti-sigma factor RsiW
MSTTSQTCPDIGVWRARIDGEVLAADPLADGLAEPAIEQHLASCPACQRLVADLRADADLARDALARLAPAERPDAAEVGVARERLQWRRAQTRARPEGDHAWRRAALLERVSTPWRVAAGAVAAAVALACVVAFTPEGNSAAAAFLAQFRSQQVSVVEVTPESQADIMRALTALSNLGTVQTPAGSGSTRPQELAREAAGQSSMVSLADAVRTVGFTPRTPDPATLPAGVTRTPTVRVVSGTQLRFTFDKSKARAYYQSTGHPEVSLPDKFDGASLTVTVPPAVLLNYGAASSSSRQEVVVVEAGELVVDTQGNVTLPEMRDFLLSLPGLPPSVVSQLKQIQNWNDTLPIPVPVDQVNWQKATINGSPGLLLKDNSGLGSAAVWHADNHLFGVAGSIKADDLERIANSLAVR